MRKAVGLPCGTAMSSWMVASVILLSTMCLARAAQSHWWLLLLAFHATSAMAAKRRAAAQAPCMSSIVKSTCTHEAFLAPTTA